jgi:hypothetical protein
MKILSKEDFERLKASGMLYVVEPDCDGTYDGYLKIVNEEERMSEFKDMKIRITCPSHSRQVQDALFNLGYKWYCGEAKYLYCRALSIYTDDEGYMCWNSSHTKDNDSVFLEAFEPEYYLDAAGCFKLVQVSPQRSHLSVYVPSPKSVSNQDRMKEILEDTDCKEETLCQLFEDNVVNAVKAMTKIDGEPYEFYIDRVKKNELARTVKMHDTLCNLQESLVRRDMRRVMKYSKQMQYLAES